MRLASLPFLLLSTLFFGFFLLELLDGSRMGGMWLLALMAATLAVLGAGLFRRTLRLWQAPFIVALVIAGVCLAILAVLLPLRTDRIFEDLFDIVAALVLVALAFTAAAVRLWLLRDARGKRAGLLIALGVVAAPALGLAWFDVAWFQPRLQQARAQVQDPRLGTDPRLAALVEADSGRALEHGVTRLLLHQPGFDTPGPTTHRIFKEIFSDWLVRLHCDRAEQRALIASLVYVGHDEHGLPAAARRLYGREIFSLDEKQLATLVALTWGPGYFEKHPERLEARAQYLLTSSRKPR